MRFSCMQDDNIRMIFVTKPMFQAALDFKLESDSTIELISRCMVTEIRDCLVSSIDTHWFSHPSQRGRSDARCGH